jgi:hypothetical protein
LPFPDIVYTLALKKDIFHTKTEKKCQIPGDGVFLAEKLEKKSKRHLEIDKIRAIL